ncbi:MAG: quinolinate synthase NadA [Acidobacteria bacterium]|nr:quinolinate synthase NadA [Acidobacteriota bacterium]
MGTITSTLNYLPDRYVELSDAELDERIQQAKAKLGSRVVILGHHYQRDEVVKFADFRGDSLKLSRLAASRKEAEYIVFCGVHFMAESADILRDEHQLVVLPDLNAGCSMADMADGDQVEVCWEEIAGVSDSTVVPVTYINSTAVIKAFVGRNGGAVCTSSNAQKVMAWAFSRGEKGLFIPDEHLGRNTGYRMGIPLDEMVVWDPHQEMGGLSEEAIRRARVILWKGNCSVHQRFLPQHVKKVRENHPGIRVIAHPECRWDVCQLADDVGSTEFIIKRVTEGSPGSQWAIGTEIHLVKRLAKENPDRTVISLDDCGCLCSTMYRISPQHLCWTLESLVEGQVVNRVRVEDETRRWARVALDRMLEIV